MSKIYKCLALILLLLNVYVIKIEAQTCDGEILFYDISQICYEDTIYLGDLIYLSDTCAFENYNSILVSIKNSDGSNLYLYSGVPRSTTEIDINKSDYKNVESFSSTSITLSFMLYLQDGSMGELYSKSYNYVRGMDADFTLPESVNPIDSDGNFQSAIPLSDIFGEGVAENTDISCSTAKFGYLNETTWNLSYLDDGMNKWNTNHTFTIEASQFQGCGSATTVTVKTQLVPEFEFDVPAEAILDYDSVLLTNYVVQPLTQTVGSVTYTGTFSSSAATVTDDNYLLTSEIEDSTGCKIVLYHIYQYTSTGTLYNSDYDYFYLPLDGPFVEFDMDEEPVACNGEDFEITINDNGADDDYMLIVEGDSLASPTSYTVSDFSDDIEVYLIQEKTSSCSVTQSVTIHADSVVADFTVSEESIEIGDYVTFTSTSYNATEYYWTFNEGDHSDLENPSHYFYTAGNQSVSLEVTSENGCTNTKTQESVLKVESSSDIDESVADQLTLWPNPVSDNLYYTTNKNQINTVEILNITGGVVKTIGASALSNTINVADLNPGIYMLLIEDVEGMQVVKFIKE